MKVQAALKAAEADIECDHGKFRIKGTDRAVSLASIIRKHAADLSTKVQGKHDPTWPNGCHIAEVEVDAETGEVKIVRYVVMHDCGNVINPMVVQGQVEGGVGG